MERLEKLIENGEITKYTKKEQLMIKREVEKMKTFFSGIKDLKRLPEAIFVLDVKYDHIPVTEAKQSKVKVIGLVDTNSDPDNVDYVIPSNDDAIKVISYMANAVAEAVAEGRSKFVQNVVTSEKAVPAKK